MRFLPDLRKLFSGLDKFKRAGEDIAGSVAHAKNYEQAGCLIIHNNRARLTKAILSQDLKYVVPKGYNLKFRNEHSLILEPGNQLFYLINVKNPQTFHPDYEPTDDQVEVEVVDEVLKDGKLIKSYDYENQTIKGGEILSKVAYDVGQTAILRFMETPARREILLIGIMSWLFGIIIGGVLGLILFAVSIR